MAPAPTVYIDEQTESHRYALPPFRNPQTAAARAGLDPFHGAVVARVRAQNFHARPTQPWFRLHPARRLLVNTSDGTPVPQDELPPEDDGGAPNPSSQVAVGSGWGDWNAPFEAAVERVNRQVRARAAEEEGGGSGWDLADIASWGEAGQATSGWGDPAPAATAWNAPGRRRSGWPAWMDEPAPARSDSPSPPPLEPSSVADAALARARETAAREAPAVAAARAAMARVLAAAAAAAPAAAVAAPAAAAAVPEPAAPAEPAAAPAATVPACAVDLPPRTTRVPGWGQRYESREEFCDRVKQEYVVAQEECAKTNKDCRVRAPCEDCVQHAGEEYFVAQEECAKIKKRCARLSPCRDCFVLMAKEFFVAQEACELTNKDCRRAFPCDDCYKLAGAGWFLAGERFVDEHMNDADTECGSVNGMTPPQTPDISTESLRRELDIRRWYARQEREVGERFPMFF